MVDALTANNVLVEQLGSALRRGDASLNDVPGLLKQLLAEEAWREFRPKRGEPIRYERFEDFAQTKPVAGLGASVGLIKRIIRDDPEALDLLDRALQRPTGAYEDDLEGDDNVNTFKISRPLGNSSEQALRKLRKDRPDLHEQVLAGNLSPHRAMVEAGFRPKTFTIRPDPPSAAQTIARHMTPDQVRELARLLVESVT